MKTITVLAITMALPVTPLFLSPGIGSISATESGATTAIQCAAPVLVEIYPSVGRADSIQGAYIFGRGFVAADGTKNVTSVFAVDVSEPTNVVQASPVGVITDQIIDLVFNFGSANRCKTFRVVLNGPCGMSTRNVQFSTVCGTPSEQLAALRDHIAAFVTSGVLTAKQGKSLTKRLDKARIRIESDNKGAGIDQLRLFIEVVEGLLDAGGLSESQANSLLGRANALISQLE